MPISDMFKEVYWVKAVPNADPDADGEWVQLIIHPNQIRPKTRWDYISSILPKGFHAVAIAIKRNQHA